MTPEADKQGYGSRRRGHSRQAMANDSEILLARDRELPSLPSLLVRAKQPQVKAQLETSVKPDPNKHWHQTHILVRPKQRFTA